jgi:hypothetical protein
MTTETETKTEEVKQETVTTAADTSTPEPVQEAPKSEASEVKVTQEVIKKEKKYVPLDELISERQRRREADKKLKELEDRVNKLSADDPVKKIATDLGVDEETARKLNAHFGSKPQSTTYSAEEQLKVEFQSKCEDYAIEHEDWFELKNEMSKLLDADVQKRGLMQALKNDPEKYYLKAKLLRQTDPEKARLQGAKETVEKLNQQNLATSEASKSSPKPSGEPKWTREKVAALSHSEYLKHEKEIKAALFGQK